MLTSSTNNILKHYLHSIGTNGALTLMGAKGDLNFNKVPLRTYMKSTQVFTFFTSSNQLYITDINTNVSSFVTLLSSKVDAKATPDHSKVIVWDTSNAVVYIHAMNSTFDLLFTYNGSKTGAGDAP